MRADAGRLPRHAIENLSRKRKTGGDRAYGALAGSTCRLSFSYSSFLVPCYVPSSPNAARMLHNTSPVADLSKLSHEGRETIMTVRQNRPLDSAESLSTKRPVSSQD